MLQIVDKGFTVCTLDARGLLVRQRRGASERVVLVGEFFSRCFATRLRRSILSPLTRKKPLAPRVYSLLTNILSISE